jgi:hypothetical protein
MKNFGILSSYFMQNKGRGMKIKTANLLLTTLVVATGLSFTACTPAPRPKAPVHKPQVRQKPAKPQMTEEEKQAAYKSAMRKVGMTIKQDASYKKLDLSTPELKEWFTDITYKLWDHQISRGQFVAYGLEKYPDRAYEFQIIADGLLSS